MIAGRSYVIEASGFADGPAQALRDHLVANGAASVTTIAHPLVPEGPRRHRVTIAGANVDAGHRDIRRPFRPPLTYPFDLVTPVIPPRAEVWFGFNNLAAARGLAARRLHRVDRVVYWAVDFFPDRFGPGLMTKAYDAVDGLASKRADLRVELSAAALDGRADRLQLGDRAAPAVVVPMGAWLDRVPTTGPDHHAKRKVVFLGHLVPRMGAATLLDAMEILVDRPDPPALEVIGGGPLLEELRQRVSHGTLAGHVKMLGFVEDHQDVERILASSSVAVAPYETSGESFTRFADPGKLKSYLAAGLPIVLTDVPPNASELQAEAGAELVEADPSAIARGIERALADASDWQRRRTAALTYVRRFDWPTVLGPVIERVTTPN
ncbi:MAG: glycosyltransferase [Acidimicrobiales bacterium]